jgi:tetratricopeptide (TPR) repeat protein
MGRSLFWGVAFFSFAVPLVGQQPQAQEPAADSAILTRVPPPAPDATPQELEVQADKLRGQKAYLDSLDYYHAAVQKKDSAQLHNKMGISYFLLHRDQEARKEYQRAVKMNKEYAEAYNNLGALYYNQRRFGSSIKEYKRALKLNDDNASFHKNLGTAYFSEKDFQAASREYQRAMALDPTVFERQPSGGIAINLISSNDLGHFHYVMAEMYGQQGDVEHCRYYLSKANEEGYPIRDALRDSGFAGLRKDPEFVSFLRSLKAPPTDPN